MTEKDRDELMLDALFDTARKDARAEASPDLMARVLQDAEDLQPAPPVLTAVAPPPEAGFWRSLVGALGGWPSVAGLSAAAAGGIWIGVVGSTSLIEDGIAVSLLSAGQSGVLLDLDTSYAFLVE